MVTQEDKDGSTDHLRELTTSLHNALPRTHFEIRRFGTYTVQEIREIYRYGIPVDLFRIRNSRPVLDDEPRAEIEQALRLMVARYIEDGSIGNGFAFLIGGSAIIPVAALVDGVVRASAIVGPEEAVQTLGRWTNQEHIPYEWYAVLSGLSTDAPLGSDEAIRFDPLPPSSSEVFLHLPLDAQLEIAPRDTLGNLRAKVACLAGPAFFLPSQLTDLQGPRADMLSWVRGSVPPNFAEVVCKALTLACNHYVDWTMEWFECAEERPFGLAGLGGSRFHGRSVRSVRTSPLSQDQLDQALCMVSRLSSVTPNHRLEIAIDRWVRSKEPGDLLDQFIDLRIALEALFLRTSERAEISYRLATRGAWYLGNDPDERARVYKQLRAAYDEASKVMHAGPKGSNREGWFTLENAQDLCHRAILQMMEESDEPDWDDLTMGGTTRDTNKST